MARGTGFRQSLLRIKPSLPTRFASLVAASDAIRRLRSYAFATVFARRPKPPSRKEQALEAISRLCASVIHDDLKDDAAIVRRALEALDD